MEFCRLTWPLLINTMRTKLFSETWEAFAFISYLHIEIAAVNVMTHDLHSKIFADATVMQGGKASPE